MTFDETLAAIQASAISQAVRYSQWRYAAVNTAHILGVALLVGAILPMDLRLLGAWRRLSRCELARVLLPFAFSGLILAMTAGVLLFIVRAKDYGPHPLFQVKMLIVLMGAMAALLAHARAGLWLDRMTPAQERLHGWISILCWVGALVCGRLIAYTR